MPTSADDLHTFLRTRRSIRRFKPDPVPAPVIERILTTATYAPSAHNLQPWRFVVIPPRSDDFSRPAPTTDPAGTLRGVVTTRQKLAHALTSSMRADMLSEGAPEADIEKRVATSLRRIEEAPVIILLCRDGIAVREHKREDEIMAIQSVANAATYLLLAVHAEGLGGNWLCWPLYAQEETRSALELPENWIPEAMFFLGHANDTLKEKFVKSIHETTIWK
jgi:coenzyme F420-0:L-glutamate ligase / coenzyme F420-1:gamma-L-glutamate ligase